MARGELAWLLSSFLKWKVGLGLPLDLFVRADGNLLGIPSTAQVTERWETDSE